jgi:hypothetical protein
VAGAGDQRHPGVRPDGGGHPAGQRGELAVQLAGEQQDRHGEAWQARPQRLLDAGAELPQGGGEAGGAVAEPLGAAGTLRRQGGEQRPGEPAVQERRHAVAFQVAGERLVGRLARGPLRGVLDPRGRAHQDQRPDQVGPVDGEPQADPAAEGVAGVGSRPAGRAEQPGRAGQVGAERARAAVPWQVDADHLPAWPQPPGERRQGGQRLGEAVRQHDPWAFPLDDVVEHPAMLSRTGADAAWRPRAGAGPSAGGRR